MVAIPPEGIAILAILGVSLVVGLLWKIKETYFGQRPKPKPAPTPPETREAKVSATTGTQSGKRGTLKALETTRETRRPSRRGVCDAKLMEEGRARTYSNKVDGLEEDEERRRRRERRERRRELEQEPLKYLERTNGDERAEKRRASAKRPRGHRRPHERGHQRERQDSGFQDGEQKKRADSWKHRRQQLVERDITEMRVGPT